MFVKSSRLAVGLAFLSPALGVVVSQTTAQAATEPPKDYCTANALSAAQRAAGGQSHLVCFATDAEVRAFISGSSGGPVTSGIPGAYVLADYWPTPVPGVGKPLRITGDSCNDALYWAPDSWQKNFYSWTPAMCSKAKHYLGGNFTDWMVPAVGGSLTFPPGFAGLFRSIKFGY